MPTIEEVDENNTLSGEGTNSNNNHQASSNYGQESHRSGFTNAVDHMFANKIESALWLTRIFTIIMTVNYFIPFLGSSPPSSYQKCLLSNAITSALRLHQRVPNFQLSREYFAQLVLEDSTHYLLYSVLFLTSTPITMALVPLFLYAILHAQFNTKQLLNKFGQNSLMFVRNLMMKLEHNQVTILRFIACTEIFLMPIIVLGLFTGQSSFLLPFFYYRFVSLRYSSRRNPYCKQLFYELRVSIDMVCANERCPRFLANAISRGLSVISQLAPSPN